MPNAQMVAKLAGFALVAAALVPTSGLLTAAPAGAAGQAQPAVAPATCLSGPGDLDGDGPPDLAAFGQGALAAPPSDNGAGAGGERAIVKSKSNITNNRTAGCGDPPDPSDGTIVKSKSNITNNRADDGN